MFRLFCTMEGEVSLSFFEETGSCLFFLNEEEKVSLFTEARSGSSPCVSKEKRREGLSFLFEDRKEGLSFVSKTMTGKFCLHLLGVGTVFILFFGRLGKVPLLKKHVKGRSICLKKNKGTCLSFERGISFQEGKEMSFSFFRNTSTCGTCEYWRPPSQESSSRRQLGQT